jgi:U3 small nucleolar RNA-associated protein 21
MRGETDENDDDVANIQALSTDIEQQDFFSSPPALDGDLVTLTLLPRSRWQTLLNLEVIQVPRLISICVPRLIKPFVQSRNKPKEPPKPPEQAPFFLPTLPGVEHRFAVEKTMQKEAGKQTRKLEKMHVEMQTVFLRKLFGEDENGDCASYIKI